jgi:NAD dependent epimerase/dehydratase
VKWKNKRVLVTGADGFIGSHLVEKLLKKGCRIRAFTYYNSFNSWGWLDSFPKRLLREFEIFSGDIRDPSGVEQAVGGVDVVFHLAALIGIPFSYHSPDSYVDTNIKGTLNVLQAARKHKVQKIIHTSTSEVFGTAQYVPMDEDHPIHPQSPYAASKSAADELALSFYHSFNIPVSVLRPFNTFGPRQSARAIIPTIIIQILAGKRTIHLGNIETRRDFNYITNTTDAFLALAESEKTQGEFYNVGTNREVSIKELVSLISKIMNRPIKIVLQKQRLRPSKSEVERLLCDPTKFKKKCAWKPRVSLEEGLKKTCQWFKSNMKLYKPEMYNV